ncbi:Hsp20/alpha crystallin family protein [Candidatus Woesebacteria bacterium]|nr:Hsp20/alpha crystallin family protein [Candidatus Woesebacteria bacterium]
MALVPWRPLSMLSSWPSVWDDDDLLSMTSGNNNLDVYETDDEVVVQANVAGVPADQVEVLFEKGVLRIKAQKAEEAADKQRQHYSKSSWNYSYRVTVPGVSMLDHNVEPDAVIKDGVVTIKLKKAEASKPKQVKVKSA